jgi:sarcosine oxidase subunit gamma
MADPAAPEVSIAELPPAARILMRGGDAAVDTIGNALGFALPRQPCRAARSGTRAALWLGPDEWLILAPAGAGDELLTWLTARLGTTPASLVDVSDRQLALEVTGPKAAELLSAFVMLDLDEGVFPVGMCTRTLLAKAEIVLWRSEPLRFRIEVWRSFAPYVRGCLKEAVLEYEV